MITADGVGKRSMSLLSRVFLLVVAVFCVACFVLLADGLSYGTASHFWIAATSFMGSSPLWFPALVPTRCVAQLRLSRRLGAGALFVPLAVSAYGAVRDMAAGVQSDRNVVLEIGIQLGLAMLFALCILVLLWPDVRARFRSRQV